MTCMTLAVATMNWGDYLLQIIVAPIVVMMLAAWLARVAIRHRYAMLLLGLLLLVAGCAIYSRHCGFLEPACNAIWSFFLERGEQWPDSSTGKNVGGVLYGVFNAAVIIYVLSILFAFFGIELINKVLVTFRVLFKRPVNVFWGYSDEAQSLAESMGAEERNSVVFVLHSGKKFWTKIQDDDSVHTLSKNGWKWVCDDPTQCCALLGAERHFFLGANSYENVECAEMLMRRIRGNVRKCKLYVRVDTGANDAVLYKWVDRWNGCEDGNFEVVIVREEALVSRKLLLSHPMLQCPRIAVDTKTATIAGDFKVLILGFGSQGRCLLSDIICDSQYLSSKGKSVPFSAHVFDRNPTSYGTYKIMCKETVSRYHIKFDDCVVGSSDFWERFLSEMAIAPYNRIVVCLPDDKDNIAIAGDIDKIYKEMRVSSAGVVFARVRNSLIETCVDSALGHDGKIRSFAPFGSMKETYSFDNIVTRKWEKGAIWLNGDYNNKPGNPHDSSLDALLWKKASQFSKESSRASFFHQRNLLRLIGYSVDEVNDCNDCFKDEDAKNHMEVLAEDEHMRWMAFHLVRGIKAWNPTDDEIAERIVNTGKPARHNAISDLNAHADLVDYSELPDVDSRFDAVNVRHGFASGKNAQEKDKGFIRSEAMRQSGLAIRKI